MKQPSTTNKPVFFRRRDLLIVAAVLLLAAVVWLVYTLTRTTGATATVTIGYDAYQTTREIRLDIDAVHHIDAALPVTLEVQDGAIRFINAVCADHLCEGFGQLRHEGDWAACLPAETVVRVNPTPG